MQLSFPQSLPDLMRALCQILRRPDVLTYFKRLSLVSHTAEEVVFGVSSIFAKNAIEKSFLLSVQSALSSLGVWVPVRFEVVSDWLFDTIVYLDADIHTTHKDTTSPVYSSSASVEISKPHEDRVVVESDVSSPFPLSPSEEAEFLKRTLNPKYQLENYIVGPSNQLAFAAADAVSRKPGQSYNPLFIYGGVGLGKTHLLQAIGNATKKRYENKHVVYTTADRFLSEYVESVKKRSTDNLRNKYAAIDVLIIDDIQFLAKKTGTQEELYKIFNVLYEAKKQIVLSGDRPPRELEELEPRLKSRFEWGIIVDVAVPDYETKLAIIQEKIAEKGFGVERDALEHIAFHAGENIRELEGILNQIIAQYELTGMPPTLENIARILNKQGNTQVRLGSTLVEPVSRVKSYEELIDQVAKHFGVDMKMLIGQNRAKQYMIPRQVAMYLLKNRMHYTLERIGNIFSGRNHSAVLYSCKKLESMLKKDQNLYYEVNVIRDKLGL